MKRWLALLLSLGCAQTGRTTWEDDAKEGIDTPTPPSPAPRTAPPDGPRDDAEAAARRLERSLLGFGAAARQTPPDERSWGRILDEVERALLLDRIPVRALVQVRVVLETERERSETMSGEVDRRIARAFADVRGRLGRSQREAPAGPIRLRWPVSPIQVTSGFGYRLDPIHGDRRMGFHAGVDLGGRRGDPVWAAAAGEVIAAGWQGGLGRAVFLQHVGGYITVYAHLSSLLVETGAFVEAGRELGLMGSTGRATGHHLHFELRLGGTPLDPVEVLESSAALASEIRPDDRVRRASTSQNMGPP